MESLQYQGEECGLSSGGCRCRAEIGGCGSRPAGCTFEKCPFPRQHGGQGAGERRGDQAPCLDTLALSRGAEMKAGALPLEGRGRG